MSSRNIAYNNFISSITSNDSRRLNALILAPNLIFYLLRAYIDISTFLQVFLHCWNSSLGLAIDLTKKTGMVPDNIRYLMSLSRQDQAMINGNLQRLNSILGKIPCNVANVDEAIKFLKGGYVGDSLLHEDSTIINPILGIAAFHQRGVQQYDTHTFRLTPNIGETPLLVSAGNLWGIFPRQARHHFRGITASGGIASLSSTVPTDFMLLLLLDLVNPSN